MGPGSEMKHDHLPVLSHVHDRETVAVWQQVRVEPMGEHDLPLTTEHVFKRLQPGFGSTTSPQ